MVHAPELLGYEQYTPFPAPCQWQSERPPPVAGAFAGLFMALGAPLLAWERPAWRAVCLALSFVGLPLSLRLILLTASAYVSRPRKEDRPWRAAHRVCLGGRRPPFWRKGTPKPANVARLIFQFASPLLAWRLLSFTGPTQVCGLRKEDRPDGRSSSFPWGPQAPFWRKGTPKTGKHRPPHFLARLSPFGLAPTVIYRAHPSLWTSAGKTRWWGSRCGGRARRGCRWRPRTPSRARRSRRRG